MTTSPHLHRILARLDFQDLGPINYVSKTLSLLESLADKTKSSPLLLFTAKEDLDHSIYVRRHSPFEVHAKSAGHKWQLNLKAFLSPETIAKYKDNPTSISIDDVRHMLTEAAAFIEPAVPVDENSLLPIRLINVSEMQYVRHQIERAYLIALSIIRKEMPLTFKLIDFADGEIYYTSNECGEPEDTDHGLGDKRVKIVLCTLDNGQTSIGIESDEDDQINCPFIAEINTRIDSLVGRLVAITGTQDDRGDTLLIGSMSFNGMFLSDHSTSPMTKRLRSSIYPSLASLM